MLNKILFDSPDKAKIAQLSQKIEAFKRYDAKRKTYCDNLEKENDILKKENKWFKEENALLCGDDKEKTEIFSRVEKLKKQVSSLTIVLQRNKLKENYSDEEIDALRDEYKRGQLIAQLEKQERTIKDLKKQNKKIKASYSKLIYDTYELREQLGNLKSNKQCE